ncbi:hypothetical protein L195_g063697, partial [Trifolium pratense]
GDLLSPTIDGRSMQLLPIEQTDEPDVNRLNVLMANSNAMHL